MHRHPAPSELEGVLYTSCWIISRNKVQVRSECSGDRAGLGRRMMFDVCHLGLQGLSFVAAKVGQDLHVDT